MKTIAFTSGKGGVGKSNITINTAITLARRGERVCILDADTGLANINILIGLAPQYTLEHFLSGEKTLSDITVAGPGGPGSLDIIPSASGVARCVELAADQQNRLLQLLEGLESQYDTLLIDTGAGISPTVMHFVGASQMPVVVITPEPTSLTDAFSLLKVLHKNNFNRPVQVLINLTPNIRKAHEIYNRFEAAVDKYIGLSLQFIGSIRQDQAIVMGVFQQHPVTLGNPSLAPCLDFSLLVDNIEKTYHSGLIQPIRLGQYWQHQVGKAAIEKEQAELADRSASVTSQHNKLPASGSEKGAHARTASVVTDIGKPAKVNDRAKNTLDETATNELIESVWSSASEQLRQIITMGKVTRAQVDSLSDDLANLAQALPYNQPADDDKVTPASADNKPTEHPFVTPKSAVYDEPATKQHQYDEATFGDQQRLLSSLRKARAEGPIQVIQLLESLKHR